MVYSEQTNIEISHLLNRWLYDVKKVTSSEILPNKVEVDFSWAMLHGVCNAFNKQNLEWYLNRCWETIHTSNSTNSIKVIIHICSAHIMNRFGYKLSSKFRMDKQRKQKIMFIMARMTSCTTMDEMNQLFGALSMVCLSKKIYPKIEESFDKLDSSICLDKEFDFDLENITELDESLPNEMGDSKTYKSRSPFGKHFQNELMNCKRLVGIFEMEEQNENTPKNNYYFPDLPSFLVTHYMQVCPL